MRRTTVGKFAALFASGVLLLAACTSLPKEDASSGKDDTDTEPVTSEQSGERSESADKLVSQEQDDAESGQDEDPVAIDDWDAPQLSADPVMSDDGPDLLFHDMRAGEHDGYYRVVAEFTGVGEPGWDVRFPEQPVEAGRGEPLDVAGDFFIELDITGTTIPMLEEDYDEYYSGPKKLAVGPLEVIEDGTFEGSTHLVIGMDEMRDFRIERLEDPARIVVDIRR